MALGSREDQDWICAMEIQGHVHNSYVVSTKAERDSLLRKAGNEEVDKKKAETKRPWKEGKDLLSRLVSIDTSCSSFLNYISAFSNFISVKLLIGAFH